MKTMILSMFAAMLTFSVQSKALASFEPDWERPILKAEAMSVSEAKGLFADAREVTLTLTKRDGSKVATGFVANINGVETTLTVTSIGDAGCGSTKYVAQTASRMTIAGAESLRLVLVDHSARTCKDLKKYSWEARLVHSERLEEVDSKLALGILKFAGNPSPVYTVMSDPNSNVMGDNDGITGGLAF